MRFGLLIAAFLLIFGGFHVLLSRPGERATPEQEQALIREMAGFVSRNPEMVHLNRNVPDVGFERRIQDQNRSDQPSRREAQTVLGFSLDSSSLDRLATEASKLELRMRIRENPEWAKQDLKQAWRAIDPSDFEGREVLQEVTTVMKSVVSDPDLDLALVEEMRRVGSLGKESDRHLEYVGRTLQRHLDSEKDPEKLGEQLRMLGVPQVVVPQVEGEATSESRSPASVSP